jgi:ABC-2 type transport system permease protein
MALSPVEGRREVSLLRIRSLVRKEFLHIVRDPRTLFVMFAMPIIQLVLLGYTATTDVEQLSTAILDRDKSNASRQLVEAYRASGTFDIRRHVSSEEELKHLVDRGLVSGCHSVPEAAGVTSESVQVGK